MKLPLLAPMSQTISPGRTWRLMISNSAFWSRNRAFSARTRNRMIPVVNHAWITDTGQPSASAHSWPGGLAKQDGGGRRTRTFEVIRRLIYSQLPLPLGTLPRPTASQPTRRNGGRKAMDDVKTADPVKGSRLGAFMGEGPWQSQPRLAANTPAKRSNCHYSEPMTQACHERTRSKAQVQARRRQSLQSGP